MLRARHEEINDMNVVLHGPLIPAPPLAPVYVPASTPVPTLKEDIEPDEPIPEPQDASEDQPEQVGQNELLNDLGPQTPMFLVINDPQWNMDFELGEPKAPEVQVIPVFLWGPLIVPQPNLDCRLAIYITNS